MPNQPQVAILGPSGFIGSRLVEWVVLRNLATVRPIVRSFKGMARLARFDLDCRVADATDLSALGPQLEGCEVLFHCVVGDRNTILKSAEVAYRAASQAGLRRLVYLSSGVVHGHDPAPGTDEDSELVADQPFDYNVSKVRAENLLGELRADGRVEVVILRPCIVFGPRSQYWTADIAKQLIRGEAYLIDGGQGICNTVYVDNLIYAMWLAAFADKARNQSFIITDGARVTWRDLYQAVAEAVDIDINQVPSIARDELPRIWQNQKMPLLQEIFSKFGLFCLGGITPELKSKITQYLPAKVLAKWKGLHKVTPKPIIIEAGECSLPIIDREIASLQDCHYMLPIKKAQDLLGYFPPVPFAEACRRTKEWLCFALGLKEHLK